MSSVFISHSHSDRGVAGLLARLLQSKGLTTFVDADLKHGDRWADKLRDEIAGADVVVVVKSPSAVKSSFVQMELGAALAKERPIVFVVPPDYPVGQDISMPMDFAASAELRMDEMSDDELASAIRSHADAA